VTGADSDLIAEERTRTRIVIEEEETNEKNESIIGRGPQPLRMRIPRNDK
jgi:hypothetical protein